MTTLKKSTSFGTKIVTKIQKVSPRHYCITATTGKEYYLNADNDETLIRAFFHRQGIEIVNIQDLGDPDAGYEYLSESTWDDIPTPIP